MLIFELGMRERNEHTAMLMYMLAVLRTRQSAWDLNESEKLECRRGIQALQAAVDAMNNQIYA